MTARASFEARCWEALAAHGRAIADGVPAKIADPPFVDAILKAWDATITRTARNARQATIRLDPEAVLAARRLALDDALSESHVAAIRRGKQTAS